MNLFKVQLLFAGKVGVPKQLFVNTDPSSIPAAVTRAGLSLPLGKSALFTVYIDFGMFCICRSKQV